MGACIGKKSSKYLKRDHSQSDIVPTSMPKIQDDTKENKSSPSSSKRLTIIDDELRISKIEESSINSELQTFLDEQKLISEAMTQPFPSRMISTTDTELEYELAKLMYELPENDGKESPVIATTTIKCDDSR